MSEIHLSLAKYEREHVEQQLQTFWSLNEFPIGNFQTITEQNDSRRPLQIVQQSRLVGKFYFGPVQLYTDQHSYESRTTRGHRIVGRILVYVKRVYTVDIILFTNYSKYYLSVCPSTAHTTGHFFYVNYT